MSFHPNDITRRSRAASLLLVAAFVWLLAAFFRAQVLEGARFALQSTQNRLREVPLPAPRATILDRHGQIIAESVPGYSVLLTLDRTGSRGAAEDSLRSALRRLADFIPYSQAQVDVAVRRFRRDPYRPVVVLSDAPFDVVSVLEERVADFPGLIIQAAPKRYYPDGPMVASFVGYTNEISDTELAQADSTYKAGQQIGKAGLEKQYEGLLRGREGKSFIEVDALNRVVRRENVRPDLLPETQPPLRTNIDMDLQRFVYNVLEGDSSVTGGIIALDPRTGGVLALHSNPSFDPNRFVGGVSASYYDSLNTDPRRPMYNKVIQGRYPPASTFKLVTAGIAMERGLANLDTHMPVPCRGGLWYGNRYFRCWSRQGHGDVSLREAIAKSCDVYFYQLGQLIGLEEFLRGGIEVGMNDRSGIDLPDETRPRWPADIKYYDEKYGPRGWSRAVTLNLSIGQGENDQTVVNMARIFTALATDGTAKNPEIVAGEPVTRRSFTLTPQQLDGLRLALVDVVSSRGTAGASAIQGVQIAGKTGTAQNSQDPNRDHGWFVGFAPVEDPKIVVAVFIQFGEHGSTAARYASAIIGHYLKSATAPIAVTEEGQ